MLYIRYSRYWSLTTPTSLEGEQEILFILSGKGTITAREKTIDLFKGITVLVPANLNFTLQNTGEEKLTMYLVNNPIPEGFRPNNELLVRDKNKLTIVTTTVHWCHIDRILLTTQDGLGTIEYITTCGHPRQLAILIATEQVPKKYGQLFMG